MGINDQEPTVQTQEEFSRRGFFKLVIGFLSALSAIAVAIPFIGSLVGPAVLKKKGHFTRVASLDSLPLGEPVEVKYPDMTSDAYITQMTMNMVWVVKHSPTDVTVYSPICPHLGCQYNWDPGARHFACPCHGSVWTLDGKVIGGPSPRPLDTLPTKIQNGEIYAEFVRFRTGIPQKIAV